MAGFNADLTNRFAAAFFLMGKFLRFSLFLAFLILLVGRTQTLAGYNVQQVVFFFLTFNLVDIISQFLLRGVYHFRPLIVTGNFDFILTKPLNPLFSSLARRTDILDLLTLIPLVLYIIFFLASGQVVTTLTGILFYLVLVLNALLVALALHIIVLCIGVLTTEVDHLIWIYRDLTNMGRVPIDIYREWLRGFLIFVIPVGVLMTFPAKALMGLLSWQWVLFSIGLSVIFLWGSIRFWRYALNRYSSASS